MTPPKDYHDPNTCPDCQSMTLDDKLSVMHSVNIENMKSIKWLTIWCAGTTIALIILIGKKML